MTAESGGGCVFVTAESAGGCGFVTAESAGGCGWSVGRLFSTRNSSNSALSSSGMKDLIPMSR